MIYLPVCRRVVPLGGKKWVKSMKNSVLDDKDENLAFRAQNGDETALSAIFERFEPYIRFYSAQYKCSGVDFDDLVQEGGIGLVSAVRFFKSDAGAAFKTFACLCIRRQILSAMRKASKKDIISLDYLSNLNSNVENPEDVVIMRERISSVKDALLMRFTPFERKLFLLYIEGFSYKSIAKELKVCTKKVDNSLQSIKRRLGVLIN